MFQTSPVVVWHAVHGKLPQIDSGEATFSNFSCTCDCFNTGNKMINQYSIIGPLGQGAYGKVKLVIHEDSQEAYVCLCVALKVFVRVPSSTVNIITTHSIYGTPEPTRQFSSLSPYLHRQSKS